MLLSSDFYLTWCAMSYQQLFKSLWYPNYLAISSQSLYAAVLAASAGVMNGC